MKIILRASNLLLFFMQRTCTFDVPILDLRLKFFLFCHSDPRILTRLHWRTAEMDARVAHITWTSCITASWKAGDTHGKITRLHSRPLWKAFCHFTRWSRAWFPFRTSMRTTREDLDGENTKTNVSVSSAMQPHCISMLAVYTEYASGTQNTCRNRSREDCTLSRVEGVAQTRSREVVLRPRSASRNNRMSSCCRRNVPVFFPFDEYYDSPARVLYPTLAGHSLPLSETL